MLARRLVGRERLVRWQTYYALKVDLQLFLGEKESANPSVFFAKLMSAVSCDLLVEANRSKDKYLLQLLDNGTYWISNSRFSDY